MHYNWPSYLLSIIKDSVKFHYNKTENHASIINQKANIAEYFDFFFLFGSYLQLRNNKCQRTEGSTYDSG